MSLDDLQMCMRPNYCLLVQVINITIHKLVLPSNQMQLHEYHFNTLYNMHVL